MWTDPQGSRKKHTTMKTHTARAVSSAEHYITNPRIRFGEVVAYGVSSWDMPDGDRLRREMSRSTPLESLGALKRWAKRYNIDPAAEVDQWISLSDSLEVSK